MRKLHAGSVALTTVLLVAPGLLLASSPSWTAQGDQAEAQFGWAVAIAGDVNGDGYDDVIVGAPYHDNGQTDEGRAYVYHGSVSGLSSTPAWTAEGDQEGALFGWSVSSAGDVNGDGYADVIIGAPYFDNGETDEGRAYLFYGSASGLAGSPGWTAEGDQAGAEYGGDVAMAGDVNGDGYDDVIVGAMLHDASGLTNTAMGRAIAYYGSGSGLSLLPSWTVEGDHQFSFMASSVASVGDVNNDGYSDVMVTAWPSLAVDGSVSSGNAELYLGSLLGLASSTPWNHPGFQSEEQFGYASGSAGDVNGDNYDDILITAASHDHGQEEEGIAYVFHGGVGIDPNPDWSAEGNTDYAQFGFSAASAGDVNGDGYADVIVGAWLFDNDQEREGRVSVFYGSANGLSASADWIAEGDQERAELGVSVGGSGDVNGDGYSDVIAGAWGYDDGEIDEGAAFVWHGSASGL